MQKDHPQGPEEEADHLLSLLKKGDILALSAFGAGFISGAAIIEW